MARLDGWFLAECLITADGSELVLCEPASDGEPANSITLSSLVAITQLRDLIDEAIQDAEARAELARQSNSEAGLTAGSA